MIDFIIIKQPRRNTNDELVIIMSLDAKDSYAMSFDK